VFPLAETARPALAKAPNEINPGPVIVAEIVVDVAVFAVALLRARIAMFARTSVLAARGATTATASVVVVGAAVPADIRTDEAAAVTAAGAATVTDQNTRMLASIGILQQTQSLLEQTMLTYIATPLVVTHS